MKHFSVRRLALYLEESLLRGSRWAVFDPNVGQFRFRNIHLKWANVGANWLFDRASHVGLLE